MVNWRISRVMVVNVETKGMFVKRHESAIGFVDHEEGDLEESMVTVQSFRMSERDSRMLAMEAALYHALQGTPSPWKSPIMVESW